MYPLRLGSIEIEWLGCKVFFEVRSVFKCCASPNISRIWKRNLVFIWNNFTIRLWLSDFEHWKNPQMKVSHSVLLGFSVTRRPLTYGVVLERGFLSVTSSQELGEGLFQWFWVVLGSVDSLLHHRFQMDRYGLALVGTMVRCCVLCLGERHLGIPEGPHQGWCRLLIVPSCDEVIYLF